MNEPPISQWEFRMRTGGPINQCPLAYWRLGVSSYELNRQRNNRINGCNCKGIAVMCVQCTMRTDDKVK